MVRCLSDPLCCEVIPKLTGDSSGHGVQILLDAVLRYDSALKEHARLQVVHAELNRQLLKRWAS